MWGFSSAGRAPALHAGGQEFESPNLQNKNKSYKEPKGSFLMLSRHLSFEEIIADLNAQIFMLINILKIIENHRYQIFEYYVL